MPSGAKKRKAAKKKQEQQEASSTPPLINHDSRSQGEKESYDDSENYNKEGFTGEEDSIRIQKGSEDRIEITDSSHEHDKSSSSTSSSSSSSSDDESREAKKKDDDEVITVSSAVPNQPVPLAGDAPFIGSTANVIVENTDLMDSTQDSEKVIQVLPVDTIITNNISENTLPKPNDVALVSDEIRQMSSSATESKEGNTSTLPESKGAPEVSRESEVVVAQEEQAPLPPSLGIAKRTSWFSCCGLFDAATGSSR